MARISTVLLLSPEQHAKVDSLIRHFRYVNTDAIRELLSAGGIDIARSTLHRYMTKLQRDDGLMMGDGVRTVIVVFDRAAGSTTTVNSLASKETILAAIAALNSPS